MGAAASFAFGSILEAGLEATRLLPAIPPFLLAALGAEAERLGAGLLREDAALG